MSTLEYLKLQEVLKFEIFVSLWTGMKHQTTKFQVKRTFCASDSSNKKGNIHPLLPALHNLPYTGGALL